MEKKRAKKKTARRRAPAPASPRVTVSVAEALQRRTALYWGIGERPEVVEAVARRVSGNGKQPES